MMQKTPRIPWLPLMVAGLAVLLVAHNNTAQASPINYCVYDPLGTQGDYFAMAKDYQLAAKRWGVYLQLKPYISESVAVNDFEAGQCDLIGMTGLRARLYNRFSGTIDAPGAVEDYAEMRNVLNLIPSPRLGKYLISGPYEVAGVIPVGAGYAFVNDRSIRTIDRLAGKKVAVLDWDKTESIMVEQFGAHPVPSDLTNYGSRFNSGLVDVIIVPTVVYKAFELEKGLGDKGGIIRRAFLQITLQLIARRDKFPQGFGQESREYTATTINHALGVIRNSENEVDERHWLYMTMAERDEYYRTVRIARAHLAREGFYDKHMLNILKRVRCTSVPDDVECKGPDE